VTRIRALLIVNPAARSAAAELEGAVRAFAAAGAACDVMSTKATGHAAELAREHAGKYSMVFVLAGDGSAVEVIGALAGRGPAVGVLPGGTGNLLARALGIPMRVADAVPALLKGRERRVDLGQLADGRYFAIGLGVGVDEAMIAHASPELKRRIGFLAYFWSGTLAGLKVERIAYRVTTDGVVREGHAVSVLVANLGTVLGGLITLGKDIRPDDGILHVVIFAPRTLWDSVRVFGRMLTGGVANDPCVSSVAGRNIRLETMPPRRAQADGELLGVTPMDIVVRPGAARLLVP
jgi:YegS/Rv2252/BmrU family lipid kinase